MKINEQYHNLNLLENVTYEFLTVLLGRLSFCTWIGGKPEVWQIVGYYLVLAAAVWIYRAGVKKSENGKIFAWKIRAVYAGMVC